jgi:putative ABC transport system substrate-binding protein
MKRRQFITILGGAAVAWPVAARGQQAATPVVGVLYGTSAEQWAERMAGFRRGLGEMGFVEGRNITIEYRWAEGRFDRMPAMATDLVGRKVSVMLIGGYTPGVRAAMATTGVTPIVFTTGNDPVAAGLVASLNRPGGNATGVTLTDNELVPKKLELLHAVIPTAKKLAVLVNPGNPATSQDLMQAGHAAARHLGLDMIVVSASTENEIEKAFATAVRLRAAGLLHTDTYFQSRRDQIAALSLRHTLPTIVGERESVVAGANRADMFRQAGVLVARILKGDKPADLPVMQPTRFELVINLKTAKALGLDVPPTLLALANEVIE